MIENWRLANCARHVYFPANRNQQLRNYRLQNVKTLPTILRLNAASCLLFGLLFAFAPEWTSTLIGNSAPLVLRVVGLGLILNGVHLLFAARRAKMLCPELLYFVLGDFAWVIGTVVLLILGVGVTTAVGVAAAILVGMMVGSLGFMQFRHARRLCFSDQPVSQ